tara:strand:+ start:409 stop:1314 length:906 start_codon:yes stop_codon:yes gene_type:complete
MKLKIKRCLVTGYKGYIGSRLFQELENSGYEVAGIDLKGCTINGEDLPGHDLCNGLPIEFYEFIPEIVFHLAAIPRVQYSIENPQKVMGNNISSTSKILNFAKYLNIPVIYSSSSSVTGNGDGPTNPYALSKYAAELEAKMYKNLYDVDTVSLRYFNVYSERQKADSEHATVVSNWMEHIRNNKSPFVTGNGTQKRDMAHLEDVVSANIFSMLNYEKLSGGAYDVGTGENISLNDIKNIVLSIFPKTLFKNKESRKGEVQETKAEILPLTKIGWNPNIEIDQGIRNCFLELKKEIAEGDST